MIVDIILILYYLIVWHIRYSSVKLVRICIQNLAIVRKILRSRELRLIEIIPLILITTSESLYDLIFWN